MNSLLFVVIVRLAAMYFFMMGLGYLPSSIYSISSGHIELFESLSFLTFCANLLISILLFCYPHVVLVGLGVRTEPGRKIPHIPEFQAAGIALIGLYFVLTSLVDLLYLEIILTQIHGMHMDLDAISPQNKATFFSSLFRFVIGISAIIGSRGLSKIITWLRTTGTGGKQDEPTAE